ncbi:cytochrome c oxidase subunit 3 [Isosphaeraceae bacterium EP7]
MHEPVATSGVAFDLDDVPLAHHFDTPEQQHQSAVLGMWAFLATEVMFFGGALTAYAVYRTLYPNEFAAASQQLSPALGAFNTVILLGSSLSVALAVRSSQLRQRRETVALLLITMVLGVAFLGIKAYEWSTEFSHHLAPGASFHYEPTGEHGGGGQAPVKMTVTDLSAVGAHALDANKVQMFFVFYFFLTGLHGFHMIIGLVILGLLASMIARRKLPATGERPVEITGLYWHFVDVVWVFLYPLLYLIEVVHP